MAHVVLYIMKVGIVCLKNNRAINIENRSVVSCTISGIRALVLTTSNARNAVSNINQCAQMGIDQFNAALANTGISNWQTKLILAGVANVESYFNFLIPM